MAINIDGFYVTSVDMMTLFNNANELEVDGKYLFLFGIYSSPKTSRGVKAAVFLRDILEDKVISCDVLAYTEDNIATAECFLEGESLNQMLVEKGFSDNVLLQ